MDYETLRAKLVKEEIERTMQEGGEFFPYTTKRLTEALCNLGEVEYIILACDSFVAYKMPENQFAHKWFSENVLRMAWDYWARIAMDAAEAKVSSIEELAEDDRAEAQNAKLDARRGDYI